VEQAIREGVRLEAGQRVGRDPAADEVVPLQDLVEHDPVEESSQPDADHDRRQKWASRAVEPVHAPQRSRADGSTVGARPAVDIGTIRAMAGDETMNVSLAATSLVVAASERPEWIRG
jgi:hypothetical protein